MIDKADGIQFYAGIGSRSAPPQILELMTKLAAKLAEEGWVLRSGHAPGADQAFERGAGVCSEIFLPWSSFELSVPIVTAVFFDNPTEEAYQIAQQFHPNWGFLKDGARALQARNVHQIYGPSIGQSKVSSCVICWTPNGSLTGEGSTTGGTGQALRIAKALDIPVWNLARQTHYEMAASKITG